jgi:hypothetical protein
MSNDDSTKTDTGSNGELVKETVSPGNRIADLEEQADEFDLDSFRADQSYDDPLVATTQSEIANGRPSKDLFVRSHTDVEKYWPIMWLLDLDGHPTLSGKYIIARSILDEVRSRYEANCKRKRVVTLVDEFQVLSVWPISVADPSEGRINSWTASALRVVTEARDKWIRVVSKTTAKEYRHVQALHDLGEPEFPDQSMQEIFNRAFEHYKIDTLDHPVLKALSGSRA